MQPIGYQQAAYPQTMYPQTAMESLPTYR